MNKKKKQPSALEQAISRLQSNAQALAGQAKQADFPVLNEFFTNAMNLLNRDKKAKTEMPKDRGQKGAYGIATLTNGGILRSDGTVQQTPQSNRLNVLRENVLQQSNFTPQAEQYIRGIQIDYQTPEGAWGVHSLRKNGPGKPVTRRIGINPAVFQQGPTTPTEVMTHELLHALDANISGEPNTSYEAEGDKSGDSYEFYPGLKSKASGKVLDNIKGFLNRYPAVKEFGDQYTSDVEAFAQYGAPRAERVLLGPMKNSYGAIFTPASKVQRSSPVYPTNNTWGNLFKDLEEGDEFGG